MASQRIDAARVAILAGEIRDHGLQYTRIERGGLARLWISAVAGGTPIRATRDDDRPGEFAGTWSPDGAWFVYYGIRGDKQELVKVQTTGEGMPVLLKAAAAETPDVPDWSPSGEWIRYANSLISPDGKADRSLPQRAPAYYAFSKDGKLLYGVRAENEKQLLFSIDIASGVERAIGSANTFEPRSPFSPSIRLTVAPDGKSLTYGTGVIRNSLWILEGFNPPDGLAARLGLRR